MRQRRSSRPFRHEAEGSIVHFFPAAWARVYDNESHADIAIIITPAELLDETVEFATTEMR